jgi:3-methylcrotonyl-CoA carboxylase alpha subunit
MIAKIICHSDKRREAALGLSHLVWDSEVWPVRTNATFLGSLLVHPDFMAGRVHTGFIEKNFDDLVYPVEAPDWLLALAARHFVGAGVPATAGFRLNGSSKTTVNLADRDKTFIADLATAVSYDQEHYALVAGRDGLVFATMQGMTWRFEPERFSGTATASASDGAILSPMPGRIIAVAVAAGDTVTKGQKLVTLEAMKMEHSLVAPFDGTIAELNASESGQVSEGTLLVKIVKAD